MMSNNNQVVKVGDWVRGISNEGEFIVGYIVSLDEAEDIVTVSIVKRDDKYTINEAIGWVLREYAKTKPDVVWEYVQNNE
ncbi:DNA alkylation repair protein, partial [Bacillus cereus group sp. TH40LC]|uniref:DNA alkylation repair protein n=1 Tax=Bacillus cereus group sp. TH40LC TaxID=3018039 RepID=UPI0022E85EF9